MRNLTFFIALRAHRNAISDDAQRANLPIGNFPTFGEIRYIGMRTLDTSVLGLAERPPSKISLVRVFQLWTMAKSMGRCQPNLKDHCITRYNCRIQRMLRKTKEEFLDPLYLSYFDP